MCGARGAPFFAFAETVFFSSIPCFLFVFRCSVYHSVKNAPSLSIKAFDTAEKEFLQSLLSFFLFENELPHHEISKIKKMSKISKISMRSQI